MLRPHFFVRNVCKSYCKFKSNKYILLQGRTLKRETKLNICFSEHTFFSFPYFCNSSLISLWSWAEMSMHQGLPKTAPASVGRAEHQSQREEHPWALLSQLSWEKARIFSRRLFTLAVNINCEAFRLVTLPWCMCGPPSGAPCSPERLQKSESPGSWRDGAASSGSCSKPRWPGRAAEDKLQTANFL